MEINELTDKDLIFFNRVRSQSREFLHDKSNYSLKQTEKWFKQLMWPYFIISIDGEKIGYFRTSNWKENSLYLGMDIDPKYRGNGYAIRAYTKMFDLLKKEYKIKLVFLEVLESNLRAHHIYKKLGFREIESIRYDKNENSIKMKLEIA